MPGYPISFRHHLVMLLLEPTGKILQKLHADQLAKFAFYLASPVPDWQFTIRKVIWEHPIVKSISDNF